MKVLMTADTVGGVWTYAMELTRALRDTQFVIATMGALPSASQLAEVPGNARIEPSEYRLEWQPDPWLDVERAGEWLLDLEDREHPDFVHLNGYAHGALPFRAPKCVVAHSCVMSWWQAVKEEDAPREWARYRTQVQHGLSRADVVIAPSAWMLGELDEHYRFETASRLIYNGRTFTPITGHDHRASIFAAGRLWDEAKNLRAVVDAARMIEWPVRIAGDGGADSQNVQYLGRLDGPAIARAYGESSIYLFPALYEPFGLSILEAALSGCALILGDIPSLREIWRNAALFVPPRCPERIAHVVNEVVEDAALRRELGERARKRAEIFTIDRMAAGYREVYAMREARV